MRPHFKRLQEMDFDAGQDLLRKSLEKCKSRLETNIKVRFDELYGPGRYDSIESQQSDPTAEELEFLGKEFGLLQAEPDNRRPKFNKNGVRYLP